MRRPFDPDPTLQSTGEEVAYLLQRAQKHQRLAETGDNSHARSVHLQLSQLYAERAAALIVVSH